MTSLIECSVNVKSTHSYVNVVYTFIVYTCLVYTVKCHIDAHAQLEAPPFLWYKSKMILCSPDLYLDIFG